MPGIWDEEESTASGTVCVVNHYKSDVAPHLGDKVAEVHYAAAQTRVCQGCDFQDTDAGVANSKLPKCDACDSVKVGAPSACKQCGASESDCCVLRCSGCNKCRPERTLKGRVRKGPATHFLAAAAIMFAGNDDPSKAGSRSADVEHQVFHNVEEPGGIKYITECEVPTEEYNDTRM